MDEILLRLQKATRKTAKLEQLTLRLLAERGQLRDVVSQLTEELEQLKTQHDDLQTKHKALKLVKSLNSETDRVIIEKKIDAYIKEIDACLKTFGD